MTSDIRPETQREARAARKAKGQAILYEVGKLQKGSALVDANRAERLANRAAGRRRMAVLRELERKRDARHARENAKIARALAAAEREKRQDEHVGRRLRRARAAAERA